MSDNNGSAHPTNGHSPRASSNGAPVPPTEIVPQSAFAESGSGLVTDWREGGAPVSATGRYQMEGSDSIDLGQMLAIFRRRWKGMALTFVAMVALSVVYLLVSKPVYQATATMQILDSASTPTTTVPGLEDLLADKSNASIDTQVQLLSGMNVREAALDSLTATQQKALKSNGDVTIEPVEKTNLLSVSTRAYKPQTAADFANAICRTYENITLKQNQAIDNQRIGYIEEQIKTIGDKRDAALEKLKQFKEQTGTVSVENQSTNLTGRLANLRDTLGDAQAARRAAQATLSNTDQVLARFPEGKLVPNGVQKNEAVLKLQGDLTALENEKASLSGEYTNSSYRVKQLQAQIDAIKSSLAREADRVVTSWQPDPQRAPIVEKRNNAQAEIWALDARISALQTQLQGARAEVERLPEQQLEFVKLDAEAKKQDDSYAQLGTTLQSLKIGQQARRPDAILTTPAIVPDAPVAPDRKKILASGLVLGILAAIALALIWDAMDDRLYSEEEVQRATNFPILAQVPHLKVASEQRLLASGDKITPLLESFRMLRANISFCATDRPIKSIVITSSVPNEGKSSAALNLAIASALGGDKTVLLDLDLRRPTQHTFLEIPLAPGFSSVVAGQNTLQEVLHSTEIPDLQVITGGPIPPNPFKMLNSQTARQTIAEIIAMADFVVIDTPPMLGLADARLISSLVDGTVMVVAMQETGRREVGRAGDLLNSTGNEILGVVMTKVPNTGSNYGGYYTYRSYGHYFDEGGQDVERLQEGDGSKTALTKK